MKSTKSPQPAPLIEVTFTQASQKNRAAELARQLKLDCQPVKKSRAQLRLNVNETEIELIDKQLKTHLKVDFTEGAVAHRKKYGGGRGQTIAKAIGMKQGGTAPWVLDATAGLAKDSYVFANLGSRVTLLERSPIVAALTRDGIERGQLNNDFNAATAQGFELINTDALSFIEAIEPGQKPDVIYLDPMYPQKKKSALVKKDMQILQKLLGHDTDTAQLLQAALLKAAKRVVVKRPKGAASLIDTLKPTLTYESKSTRYDVYVCS